MMCLCQVSSDVKIKNLLSQTVTEEPWTTTHHSKGLFMKHYSNINNSGYNWSSVPLKKMSIVDNMIQKIHKPRVKK